MKNSPRAALAALLLCLMLLSACGRDQGQPQTSPPVIEDTTGQTTAATVPTESTEPPTTASPLPPGPINTVDTSFLTDNGLSVQRIFLCDSDTLLFFVSPVNSDGTLNESTLVYSYSFDMAGFRAASFYAGVVNLYPRQVMDDGTVPLVTLDSESYAFDSLIFLDPITLSAERCPLPQDDFYDLHIAPNRQYAAITTYDYLRVTDMTYTEEYVRIERELVPLPPLADPEAASEEAPEEAPPESLEDTPALDANHEPEEAPPGDDEPELDEKIPSATAWSADSRVLTFQTLGWEESYAPGIISVDSWEPLYLETLVGCALTPLGSDRYFYITLYPYLPAGSFSPEAGITGTLSPAESEHAEDINAVSPSPSGLYACVLSLSQSDQGARCTAEICRLDTGQSVNSFVLEGKDNFAAFEQALFTPAQDRVVLVARDGSQTPRTVYTFDFLLD